MFKRLLMFATLLIGSIACCIGLVEFVVFRLLLKPSDVPRNEYADGVIRYEPNQQGVKRVRSEINARFSINAQGWNSAHPEYSIQPPQGRHRIAIIGDSFVEAFQVDSDKSLAERLEACLGVEVYRFGLSGSPMSHYLHVLRHEALRYHPDCVIIVLIHNDFVESFRLRLGRYTISFLRFRIENGVVSEIPPRPYERPWWYWLRGSATYRYLVDRMQLRIQSLKDRLLKRQAATEYVANVGTSSLEDHWSDVMAAAEYFFAEFGRISIEAGIQPVVLVESARREIYAHRGPPPLGLRLSELCRSLGDKHDVMVVDLQPAFERNFAVHAARFEFECDRHWNELGHQVAADTLCSVLSAALEMNGVPSP